MKRSPSRPSKGCNMLLGFVSAVHIVAGCCVIVFQILLIQSGSPYHDISGGLWSGPIFFIQGILGFVSLCDTLMCSVVSFLILSIGSALLTIAVAAVAAVDLGSVYKCSNDYYGINVYQPPYCVLHIIGKIKTAAWGIVITAIIELLATVCSVYICMRLIYNSEPIPASRQPSHLYLYDEIPSPSQGRFRGSLQAVDDKIHAFRKSQYSLNSTLPMRSKSVDKFSESSDSDVNMLTSTHSVNIIPSGRKKGIRTQNANSVYSVIHPPNRPNQHNFRPKSTPSLNVNSDLPGHMKHTAV